MDVGIVKATFIANTLGAIRNIQALDKTMSKTGANIKRVAKTIGIAYTGALAGIATMSVKLSLSWDKAMDSIAVATGATGKTLQGLKQMAEDVYKATTQGMDKTAGTIGVLNTMLNLQGKALEELTKKILYFSELTGTDPVQASEQLARAFNRFNIQGQKQLEMLDFLFAIMQKTNISFGNLLETITTLYPFLSQMGLGFEESALIAGYLYKQGIDLQSLFRGFAMATDKASEKNMSLGEAFKYIITQVKLARTEEEKLKILNEWFGTRGGPIFLDIISRGATNVNKLRKELGDYNNAIMRTRKETYGFAEAFTEFRHKVDLILKDIGDKIIPLLQNDVLPLLERLAEMIKNLIAIYNQLSPPAKKFVNLLILTIPAITGLSIAIFKLITVGRILGQIITVVLGAKVWGVLAKWLWHVGFQILQLIGWIGRLLSLLGPLRAGLLGLAVVTISFFIKYKTDENFKQQVDDWICRNIVEPINELGIKIAFVLLKLETKIRTTFEEVKKNVEKWWEDVKKKVENTFKPAIDLILNIVFSIGTKISDVFKAIKDWWDNIWGKKAPKLDPIILGDLSNQMEKNVIKIIDEKMKKADDKTKQRLEGIKQTVGTSWANIFAIIQSQAWEIINDAQFKSQEEKVKALSKKIVETFKIYGIEAADISDQLAKDVIDAYVKMGNELIFRSIVPDMMEGIVYTIKGGAKQIQWVSNKMNLGLIRNWKELYRVASIQFEAIQDRMSLNMKLASLSTAVGVEVETGGMQEAQNQVQSFMDKVKEFFEGLGQGIINVINGIRNFISGVFNWVVGFLKGIGDWIYTNVLSPIVEWAKQSIDFIRNLAIGTWNWLQEVGKAIFGSFYQYLEKEFSNAFKYMSNFFTGYFGKVFEQIGGWLGKLKDPIGLLFDLIIKFIPIQEILSGLMQDLKPIFDELKSALTTILGAFNSVIRDAMVPFKDIIKIAVQSLAKALMPVLQAFVPILYALVPVIETIMSLLEGPLVFAIKVFATAVLIFIGVIALLWNGIVSVVQLLMGWLIGDMSKFYIDMQKIGEGLTQIWNYSPPQAQEGGIVRKPTLALVGEAGPEAIIPLERGGFTGGGIVINITGNYILSDEDVERLGERIVRALRMRGVYF